MGGEWTIAPYWFTGPPPPPFGADPETRRKGSPAIIVGPKAYVRWTPDYSCAYRVSFPCVMASGRKAKGWRQAWCSWSCRMLLVGTRAGACSAHVRFSIDIGTRITVVVGRVHWLSCCWVSAGHVAVSCMYLSQCNTRRRSFQK